MNPQTQAISEEINKILAENLPGFWYHVNPYTSLGGNFLAIKIACSSYEINRVEGQRINVVSLRLNLQTLELNPQVFGGNGGQSIYRDIDANNPLEKYLAMKSVKVPFRKPQNNLPSIYKAIQKFCVNYKETLTNNIALLRHKDIVDYNQLLQIK
jgi:hypothetical protein